MSTAAPPSAPRVRARHASRRAGIMAAASHVLAERGLSGFGFAAVADRIGLHPVSLTYYFKKKEDLAAACVFDTLARFEALIAEAAQAPTAPERLRNFVAGFFELRRRIALDAAPALAPFSELPFIGGEHHQALLDAFWRMNAGIADLLEAAELPWLTPLRRRMLARLVLDQLLWCEMWLVDYEPQAYGRIGERVADVMIGGLAAPGRPWPEASLLELAPAVDAEEVSRERFLIAATELINREGYRAASVRKIAAELNVTKGSFYHHLADKEALALACFERSFELIAEARGRAAGEASHWARLWLAGASLTVHQALGRRGRLIRHYALGALPPERRGAVVRRFRQTTQGFAGTISDGIAEGSIRPVDPQLAAHLVMAMINSGPPPRLIGEGAAPETVLDLYVRPVLTGFFTPPNA